MRTTKTVVERFQRAFGSIEGLAGVVRRLTQEVEVLKAMLRDRGVWDEATYKKQIVHRFIADHNSSGFGSERHYSYYGYALEEATFLKYRFNAPDEELAAFAGEVDRVSTLT